MDRNEIRDPDGSAGPFGVWTPADFLDLGSRDARPSTFAHDRG